MSDWKQRDDRPAIPEGEGCKSIGGRTTPFVVSLLLSLTACSGADFTSEFVTCDGGAACKTEDGASGPGAFGPSSSSQGGSGGMVSGAGGLGSGGDPSTGGAVSSSPASSSASGPSSSSSGIGGSGGAGGDSACGPATCAGCCDDAGACQAGDTADACGKAGAACSPCRGECGWQPPNYPASACSPPGVLHRLCWQQECLTLAGECCNLGEHCDDAVGDCTL
jgi:hypothetical protein